MSKREIDPARAWFLRQRTGLTYAEIGRHLARELGRSMPFSSQAIARAVTAHEKARKGPKPS